MLIPALCGRPDSAAGMKLPACLNRITPACNSDSGSGKHHAFWDINSQPCLASQPSSTPSGSATVQRSSITAMHVRHAPHPSHPLGACRGFGTQWDVFFDQIEELATQVPTMVVAGNHERDWPGTGDRFWDAGYDSGEPCHVLWAKHAEGLMC